MLILVMAGVLVLIICAISFIRFVMDDFGKYNCLKSYGNYLRDTLEFPCEILLGRMKKQTYKTPNGVLYHPANRPESFFKEGDEVVFFNIRKRTPYYGDDMGVVTKDLPEGPVMGVVKSANKDGRCSTITVEFSGGKELQVYLDSPLLMHKWERLLIRKKPVLRRLVYCLDLCETINDGLNKAIKA